MEEQTFLQTLKRVFEQLKTDGLVTQEEIAKGFTISIEWLVSEGITEEIMIETLRNLHRNDNPRLKKITKEKFKEESILIYSEKDGVPYIESILGKGSVVIIDEYMPLDKKGEQYEEYLRMVLGSEFIHQILTSKKTLKKYEIQNFLKGRVKSEEKADIEKMAKDFVKNLFDDRNELSQAIPKSLNEMAISFQEHYRRLHRTTHTFTYGGLVNPRKDELGPRTVGCGFTVERLSEIYPFYERDKMYREFNPIRILVFDRYDKNNILARDFTLYIFENPDQQDGYLCISEPFEGNKETRTFFIPRENIKLKDGEDVEEFWRNLGKDYISMSGKEFREQDGTSILKHTGTMEDFKKKIGGILGIEKITNEDSQYGNIKKIRKKLGLLGKDACRKIVYGVTPKMYHNAEAALQDVIRDDCNGNGGHQDHE